MENLTSTKFWLTILILGLSYGLVFANKLDAKTWFEFATITLGTYTIGNVASKFAK